MSFSKTFLSNEVVTNLEVIDYKNKKIQGIKLIEENIITTKEGDHIISLTPFSGKINKEEFEHFFTIKSEKETKVETHHVSTLKELAGILTDGYGVTLLYRKADTGYCVFKDIVVAVKGSRNNDDCNICPYCVEGGYSGIMS